MDDRYGYNGAKRLSKLILKYKLEEKSSRLIVRIRKKLFKNRDTHRNDGEDDNVEEDEFVYVFEDYTAFKVIFGSMFDGVSRKPKLCKTWVFSRLKRSGIGAYFIIIKTVHYNMLHASV